MKTAAVTAARNLQTPPTDDDDDAVSDTNEQYYSFDSEDQEQQQDVEEQQQDEELEDEVQHAEEEAARHTDAERTLQGRVVEEEKQVVETVVQVEEQEVFEGDDQNEEEVVIEKFIEVQEVVHEQNFEYMTHISKLEQAKDSRSRIASFEIDAEDLVTQKTPREETRRLSKRKRDVVLFEEQSSQDASELNEEKQSEDHGSTLFSIEEQDSQDASLVTSAEKGLELNEISAEEVAECLHEKVLCETELHFSDSSEENSGKKRLVRADNNTANVRKTTKHTTTRTVKEVIPALHFSDSDEERSSDGRVKKSRKKMSSVVPVKMVTTTTSSSRRATKGKEVLPDLHFSDSEEDNVPKKMNAKSFANSSTSSVKLSGKSKVLKESLPVLQFSDSEEELQVEKRSKMSSAYQQHQVHVAPPGNIKRRETLGTLNLSTSEEEEEEGGRSLQPSDVRLKENSVEEINCDNKREESEVKSRHVEAMTAAESTIRDEIVEAMNSSEQMEATTTTVKSLASDETVQELDSLEQMNATTTMDKSLTSNEIDHERNCSEKVEATVFTEFFSTKDEAIEEQQASSIKKTAIFPIDASLNTDNVSSVSSACTINNNTNNVIVQKNTSTKIMQTSLSSPVKRRSVKPLAILDTPSKPSPHALALLQASVVPEANEPSEIPVNRRRGKSEDRIGVTIRGTPSKVRSSFGGELELTKLMKGRGTPISAGRARAMSEEPSSVRRDTPAKAAMRGRRLSGTSTTNIIEPPEKFADVETPVTPLRRSSRRQGGESPIIAQDVGAKGEVLQISSRMGHNISLLQKIEENDLEESNLLPSVDIPVASTGQTENNDATITIKLEERLKTDTKALDSEIDGFESDSSMALSSPSRRGRRSSLGGVTEVSSLSTPLRRSSRRSVTPSKFVSPVIGPVPEENLPTKAKRTPLKSAIKDLLDEETFVTPNKTVEAPEQLTTPSSGARRGRRKSVEPGSLTPSQSSVSDANVVSTLTPGRRTRRKSITSLEPLHVIEETSEVEEESLSDVSPSSSGKSSRPTKRLSVAPELSPIMEHLELPKTVTPVKGRRSRQSSSSVSEETQVESDAATSSQTLLQSATIKTPQQILSSRTPARGTPLKTDSTELDKETGASAPGRGRRRSSMASTSGTRNPRLRKSIASMMVTSGLDTPSSDEGRRSTRPSPALSSSVVYQTRKVYSSSEEEDYEEEDQESPYPPSLTEDQSEDEHVFSEGEDRPRGTKLRPLKKASPKEQAAGGGAGSRRRRLSHASVASSTDRKSVGLKRGRESMKITELQEEEGEGAERRTKRPRRGPSAAGGRGDE